MIYTGSFDQLVIQLIGGLACAVCARTSYSPSPGTCATGARRVASRPRGELCTQAVIEFLQSKCLFAAERALRTELELESQRTQGSNIIERNLWTSKLEKVLLTAAGAQPIRMRVHQDTVGGCKTASCVGLLPKESH